MAIASCSVQIISRGKGRSAVAAAAYRTGQELQNAYDGLSHNYTRKGGILYSAILTPAGAPDWAQDRQQLWNMVEQTERRKDAQLAREVMIALPRELSPSQNISLAQDYAQTFVEQGMIADVSVHDSRDGNPHAHILLTLRPLAGDSFGKKCREWNTTEKLIEWREQYAELTNRYLDRYRHDQRIDARSYEAQGIDLIPTIHLGPHAHRLEQRGIPTDRGDINREIEKDNQRIREIVKEMTMLELERERLQSEGFSLVEHYRKLKEQIRKTAEELGSRLTEKGRDILTEQQKNIEKALSHLKRPVQGQEASAHPAPRDEPGRQWPSGSGERDGSPAHQPRPEQEQPGAQDQHRASPHPYRSPSLHRNREDRHLAQERWRHRQPGQKTPGHHVRTEETERRRKAEYDSVYDRPPTNQAQEPKHHSHVLPRGRGRKTDYDRVYEKPTDGNNEYRRQERDRDDPEREM